MFSVNKKQKYKKKSIKLFIYFIIVYIFYSHFFSYWSGLEVRNLKLPSSCAFNINDLKCLFSTHEFYNS